MSLKSRTTQHWKFKLTSVGILLFALATQSSRAADAPALMTEEELLTRTNWVMDVTCTKVRNYMDFPPYKFYPVTQMRITFIKCSGREPEAPVPYEDLWYHDGQPIGLKRYSTLQLNRYQPGTIFVNASPEVSANTIALANTIIRLSVDTVASGSEASVVVPEELHRQLITDFGTYGFRKRSPRSGQQASIRLVANPRVFDDTLYYDRPDD